MITETLKAEHQLILQWIGVMEQMALQDAQACANAADSMLCKNADTLIGFIREYADAYHHAKEEEVLFKYLAVPGVLNDCNPLPVMLSDHTQARELVTKMQYAASLKNVTSLIEHVRSYASLLKQHIFKEDNILYAMAERGLSDGDKDKIIAEYAVIDDDPNNQAIIKRYQELLDELRKAVSAK